MRRSAWAIVLVSLIGISNCGGGGSKHSTQPPSPVQTGSYAVTAWSELGMHCIDGKDYSVFAVLPPYNTIHAQVVLRSDPPSIPAGVTVTYEAVADSSGSKNTSSSGKTNFWTYVQSLFGSNPSPDIGLTGALVQSTTPHPMSWNATAKEWDATGIPTVPYDDSGARNPYPTAKIVVRDSAGTIVASTTLVLAVSDEMTCSTCHASGSNPAAKPSAGWENNPDPAKDSKLNILKTHDDHWNVATYLAALHAKGFDYQSSLYQTAKAGTPVLCASCHATNALGAAGIPGISPLTTDMHMMHASVLNPATGLNLDNATSPTGSCYLCHPGVQTKCQRGAMNKVACFDCHGNLTKVGSAQRQGWIDLPSCQMCHSGGARQSSTLDLSTGAWRQTTDNTFATNPDKPSAGKSLYKVSTGHGGFYCAACHGSQHAEYPTLQANDNLYSTSLQGYAGKIVECTVCHLTMPSTTAGGPHGLHTIGQNWVRSHRSAARSGGSTTCTYCHGTDFHGSPLSAAATARTFSVENGSKTFPAGHQLNCYDCHNGPNGG